MIILIDENSIRPNPNAGCQDYRVCGRREVTFAVTGWGTIPQEGLQEVADAGLCVFTKGHSWIAAGAASGYYDYRFALAQAERFEEAREGLVAAFPGSRIGVATHTPTTHLHAVHPEGKFLFRYQPQTVVCGHTGCGWSGEFDDLDLEDYDTGALLCLCPGCGNVHCSYDEVHRETVWEMLKRTGLSPEGFEALLARNDAAFHEEAAGRKASALGWECG